MTEEVFVEVNEDVELERRVAALESRFAALQRRSGTGIDPWDIPHHRGRYRGGSRRRHGQLINEFRDLERTAASDPVRVLELLAVERSTHEILNIRNQAALGQEILLGKNSQEIVGAYEVTEYNKRAAALKAEGLNQKEVAVILAAEFPAHLGGSRQKFHSYISSVLKQTGPQKGFRKLTSLETEVVNTIVAAAESPAGAALFADKEAAKAVAKDWRTKLGPIVQKTEVAISAELANALGLTVAANTSAKVVTAKATKGTANASAASAGSTVPKTTWTGLFLKGIAPVFGAAIVGHVAKKLNEGYREALYNSTGYWDYLGGMAASTGNFVSNNVGRAAGAVVGLIGDITEFGGNIGSMIAYTYSSKESVIQANQSIRRSFGELVNVLKGNPSGYEQLRDQINSGVIGLRRQAIKDAEWLWTLGYPGSVDSISRKIQEGNRAFVTEKANAAYIAEHGYLPKPKAYMLTGSREERDEMGWFERFVRHVNS